MDTTPLLSENRNTVPLFIRALTEIYDSLCPKNVLKALSHKRNGEHF